MTNKNENEICEKMLSIGVAIDVTKVDVNVGANDTEIFFEDPVLESIIKLKPDLDDRISYHSQLF